MSELLALKIVIRTRSYEASRDFYLSVLNLPLVEEWDELTGRGCILRVGWAGSTGLIEISEIHPDAVSYSPAFAEAVQNDKIDIQIETPSVADWSQRLAGHWPVRGPVQKPWGAYYLYLRDPDGLQIILYETVTTD